MELKAKDMGLSLGDGQVKLLTEIAKLKGEVESSGKIFSDESEKNKHLNVKLGEISEENDNLSRSVIEVEEKLAVMTVELQRAGSSDLLLDLRKLESEKQVLVGLTREIVPIVCPQLNV